jgi:predicted ArsR family transcriptional regulator
MYETGEWIEYGETRARVVHAIETRPEDGFTARSLAAILGLPTFEVRNALDELTADGFVVWSDGEYASVARDLWEDASW